MSAYTVIRRTVVSGIAVVLLPACPDRDVGGGAEQCYEENPDPGAKDGPFYLVCGQPLEYRPETPDGIDENAGPYHVVVCDPEPSGECQHCPAEDVTERVREHLIEVMSESDRCSPPEVQHITPECVTTVQDANRTECCINAWYWGSCNIKG